MASSKELIVEKDKSGSAFFIRYAGGGELPPALKGIYTKQSIAQEAIDNYIKNGKRGRAATKG